jgi:hypothetical protein
MLLILGLDGATLDLVEPWIAEGRLPHLARLRRDGAWGRLASTVPAATFPSWTSFMTGVNPGRHGVLDFTRRERGEYRVRFVNATYRKAPTIWRLLSDAGRRVSVLGLPGTYPPEPINGYMVSGFDTPVTTRADERFVYPPAFADEVAAAGGFPFADFQEFSIGPAGTPKRVAGCATASCARCASPAGCSSASPGTASCCSSASRTPPRIISGRCTTRARRATTRRRRRRSAIRCAPSTWPSMTRSVG